MADFNFSDTTPAAPANSVNGKWQNDNTTPPNFSVNVPSGVGGVTSVVAKSLLTAQGAAITATTIYAIPSSGAGLYRITYEASVTTADGTSSTLGGTTGFQIKFTNANGDVITKTSNPTTATISAGNTTATTISGVVCGYAGASTNLQYLMGYTSNTPGQMKFDLAIFVEYLGS